MLVDFLEKQLKGYDKNIAEKKYNTKAISSLAGSNIHITDSVESNMILNGAVKNLLFGKMKTYTRSGVTYELNSDGSYNVSGTSTHLDTFADIIETSRDGWINELIPGKTYTFACYTNTGEIFYPRIYYKTDKNASGWTSLIETAVSNWKSFILPSDACVLWIRAQYNKVGTVPDNTKLYVMLEEGTVAHDYVPPMYDIKSCGKNLLNTELSVSSAYGLSWILNSDKSVTIDGGSPNAEAQIGLGKPMKLKPNTKYVMSIEQESNYVLGFLTKRDSSGAWLKDVVYTKNTPIEFTTDSDGLYALKIYAFPTFTYSNYIVKPMIRLASDEDDTYEPYQSAKVTVNAETVFPLNGLKSFNGVTNVFNDYNAEMEVAYANDEVGASVLDSLAKPVNFAPNPNLLDNPWFTVNQRGKSEYIGDTMTIDRWRQLSSNATMNITNGGISCITTNTCYLVQYTGITDYLLGKVITFSVMLNDGTIKSKTMIIPSALPNDELYIDGVQLDSNYSFDMRMNKTKGVFPMLFTSKTNVTSPIIRAVKLELGSVSTLANDIVPNYQQELAKCQRYYQRYYSTENFGVLAQGYIKDTTTALMLLPLQTPMRAKPSIAYDGALKIRYGNLVMDDSIVPTSIAIDRYSNAYVDINCKMPTQDAVGSYAMLWTTNTNAYIELSADL